MSEKKSEAARWTQVGATIFLGVVGLIFTIVQFQEQEKNRKAQVELQEKNRKAQVGLQLISQRELSEINFRQEMFQILVTQLLDPEVDVRERVMRLTLFQHNFNDIFNARALFDALEAEANRRPEPERKSLIHDLVSLAREVTREQELLVGAEPNITPMKEGETTTVKLKPVFEEEHEAHTTIAMAHRIDIVLLEVREFAVDLRVTPYDEHGEPMRPLEFPVSYFDAPLTDNTLLPDKHRFAITLKETDISVQPHRATLNVFEFPKDYMTMGYRPPVSEINRLIEEGLQH